jgi:Ca2+-binding RTX toxin-like protein
MRRAASLALALAIPAIAASPAAAGTVSLGKDVDGQMKFEAAAGEYNNLEWSTTYSDEDIRLEDNRTITLGTGTGVCTRDTVYVTGQGYVPDPTTVICPKGITSAYTSAGDKDDHVVYELDPYTLPRTTYLGAGEDDLDDHTPAGPSTAYGEAGFDDLSTYGSGNDTLYGGDGNDSIYSNDGADKMNGGLGADTLRALNDAEDVSTLKGDEGNDSLYSGNGNDLLYGGTGDDSLEGDRGTDTLDGGDGNDRMDGDDDDPRAMPDTFIGGTGVDTVDYGARISVVGPVNVNLDGVANDGASGEKDKVGADVENITGTWYDDVLTGNGNPNEIHGLYGDDIVTGAGGSDQLEGESDADQVFGGTGDDLVTGGGDDDALDGGDGNDDIFGQEGDDDVFGGDGADKIRSGDDFDDVDGGPGLDNIDAGSGSDTLRTRDDRQDQVACSGGADLAYIDFEDVTDGLCSQVVKSLGASVDRVSSRIVFTSGAGAPGAPVGSTMSVTLANGVLTFADTKGTLAAGSGCTQNGAKVNCPAAGVEALTMDGNDGNDTINQTLPIPTRFIGGPGDDKIGDSPAADSMFGNDGNDTFTQSSSSSPDGVYGGDGKDAVTYASRAGKVAVTLDSIRNDGADPDGDTNAEEGDYVRSDVEDVTGGAVADYLKGSGIGNTLNGGAGADFLTGGLGKDTLNGGAGVDVIDSRDNNPDSIFCQTDGGKVTLDTGIDAQTGCTVQP